VYVLAASNDEEEDEVDGEGGYSEEHGYSDTETSFSTGLLSSSYEKLLHPAERRKRGCGRLFESLWGLFGRAATTNLLRRRKLGRRCIFQTVFYFLLVVVTYVLLTALFWPSYTPSQYPPSWSNLEEAVREGGGSNPKGFWREEGSNKTTVTGRGNPNNEHVFIAANIVNAHLIEAEWGDRVMELIDLLGERNVFLSIFENDSGVETTRALEGLSARIKTHMPNAGQSIVSTALPLSEIHTLQLSSGEKYVKRIAYLAEVRNRALLPLSQNYTHPFPHWIDNPGSISRILFLNDVVFSPRELIHLLFSTNSGDYAAACGVDFINPFKFYDTFATRDPEGLGLGLPFFPYFATQSPRSGILHGSAQVPMRSCWGGAIAFNASFFTRERDPIRFRAEEEPFWDASECCLVNADIDQPERTFVNPFVRSAYDRRSFDWLPFVRRVERTFVIPHVVISTVLGLPRPGARVGEEEGEKVSEKAWNGAQWEQKERVVGKGGFCGAPKLMVIEEKDGERTWGKVSFPAAPPAEE